VASTSSDNSPVHLSLSGIPRRERVAIYREVIGPHVVGLDIEPVAGAPFFADLTVRRLPGLEVVSGTAGASINSRTPALLADGNDSFGLTIVEKGAWRVTSRGREIDETRAEAYLMSFADPSVAMTPGTSSIVALQIPRAVLAGMVANIDDATMRPIPLDSLPMRLLRGYLAVLANEARIASTEVALAAAGHMHDLIALAVGATREGATIARDRGLAAARLQAAKADIVANLIRRDLSVEGIAARQQVTARHLQRLFEADGLTFSTFVLRARLARAHSILADRRGHVLGVAAIAYDCGFGDLSHFNRAFRQRYGTTPSEVRAAALSG
jgi:AraC-like DNA-binding protein